jgi:hypothetical protein
MLSKEMKNMAFDSVNVTLRPIKFAFLVNPNHKPSFYKAIQISSFAWGGVYNPIIPCYSTTEEKKMGVKAQDIITNYIDAFDPDFLIPISKIPKRIALDAYEIEIIPCSEVISDIENNSIMTAGIGLFELMDYIYEKEFKFVRRVPYDISFPQPGKQYSLFLNSLFGSVSRKSINFAKNRYKEHMEINIPECSLNRYFEFMSNDFFTLSRINRYDIKPIRMNYHSSWQCIFLMDASDKKDILEFWNLRAMGFSVLPIAKQVLRNDLIWETIASFLDDNYFPLRNNPNLFHCASIISSSSLPEEDMNDFFSFLKKSRPQNYFQGKYSRSAYPDISEKKKTQINRKVCCAFESIKEEYETDITDRVSIKSPSAKMAWKYDGKYPKYANDVTFGYIGDEEEPLAKVIPRYKGMNEIIGWFSGEWRISNNGLTFFPPYAESRISLKIPTSEHVIKHWLKLNGWNTEISRAGKIAKQMLKQLGGISWIPFIVRERLIELLNQISGKGCISEKDLRAKINELLNKEKTDLGNTENIISHLLEQKIFQLGIQIKCPICNRHLWIPLVSFPPEIECTDCLSKFPIPTHAPAKQMPWAYRICGPFSIPGYAHGSYSVLLTLNFLKSPRDRDIAPMLSFDVKMKPSFEIDLCLFVREDSFYNVGYNIVFVECKSYDRFKEEDIERMGLVARKFPGAIIAFSTFNNSLSGEEEDLLKLFVEKTRQKRERHVPVNPVLILTGNELFSSRDLTQKWELLSKRHKKFAESVYSMELVDFCNITQQVYLKMDSWNNYE